jgi:hypothetical protein
MTIFKVPWIPRYVTEVEARLILASAVRHMPDRVWRWVFAGAPLPLRG